MDDSKLVETARYVALRRLQNRYADVVTRRACDSGRRSVAYGVYHDDYREVRGRWWIAGRRYHSLARTGTGPADLDVFPFPDHLRLPTD